MGCYRTILVAYDGSPEAQAAARHAGSLACDQHARLVLLTVVPNLAAHPVAPGTVAVARDIERDFAKTLRDITSEMPPDVGVESRLVHGKPASKILEVARELRCDLIVMGARGHGRLHDALTGCTSATVVRESQIPVLLVRTATPTAAEPSPAPEPVNIEWPVDVLDEPAPR
jgi:nucleotide-binding universal stress UspA family protein